jgi:hypothetical protein
MKKINKYSKNNKQNMPDGEYGIKNISMKEIIDKYPDKIIEVIDNKKTSILVLDTCKVIFTK